MLGPAVHRDCMVSRPQVPPDGALLWRHGEQAASWGAQQVSVFARAPVLAEELEVSATGDAREEWQMDDFGP